MSRTAQLTIGAVTDFVMTAGATLTGYMMGQGGVVMPSAAMLVLAVIIGLVAAAKQVRGMAMDLKPLIVLLALAVSLSGCTALYGQMSPDQLAALSKVKDAHAGCTIINTPYGRGVVVWANSDKGVLGKLTIDAECKVSIEGPEPRP